MNAPEAAPAVLHSVPTGHVLKSPTNPRKRRNAAADAELAESVKAHGILQPLLVRRWQVGMTLPPAMPSASRTATGRTLRSATSRWSAAPS